MTNDMPEETTHESWTGKLDAYLDGEIDSSQMQELDRHLRACPGCTAEALRRLQWKRAIHAAGQCYVPDPALRDQIQRSISPAKPAWWHWRPAFAATAAVLLLFAAARIVQQEIVQPKARLIQNNLVQNNLVQRSRILGELAEWGICLTQVAPICSVRGWRRNTPGI